MVGALIWSSASASASSPLSHDHDGVKCVYERKEEKGGKMVKERGRKRERRDMDLDRT